MNRIAVTRAVRPRAAGRTGQRGAVLLVALIILVVLTLLGISTINTTQLEEKMAANSQEANRAFHAAESGLSEVFNTSDAWDISGDYEAIVTSPVANDSDAVSAGQAGLGTTFLGFSPPPTSSLYSATSFHAANFDFQSDACTDPNVTAQDVPADGIVDDCLEQGALTVTVHGGAYQIAPKTN